MKTVYCHFSFRRPKGKDYGLFAVAFYVDKEGKRLISQATRKFPLWKNHQFVTAIQSYEHALYSIYSLQGALRAHGFTNIMLVTDNSTLAGWIEDPRKNKAYTAYMNRAVEMYRVGAPKEIVLGIGLCDVRDYEKSYKFCKEDKVINDKPAAVVKNESSGKRVINLDQTSFTFQTINEIEAQNPNKPEIVGFEENE